MIAVGETTDLSKLVLLADGATSVGELTRLELNDDAAKALVSQVLNLLEARAARNGEADGLSLPRAAQLFPPPVMTGEVDATEEAAMRDAAQLRQRQAEERKAEERESRRARALADRGRG